jgi:multidrug resistance efflux pump
MAARGFISANDAESAASHRDESAGLVKAARALLTEKELRLGNTRVQAPVNGIVTNLRLSPGTFLRAGQEILALIDEDSWHVSAYFEKTSLHNLKPGATAEVRLLMYPDYVFQGPVEGIGWGVFQSDGSAPDSLLPTLQPTADWVRLAARVPVRVNLRNFDRDRPLRIGARATVKIFSHSTYKEPEPKQ